MSGQFRSVKILLRRFALGAGATLFWGAAALAQSSSGTRLSSFGLPGLIDTPTAETLEDAEIALSFATIGKGILRNTAAFQITPRLTGSFRYAAHGRTIGDGGNYDRSFDFSYLLLREGKYLPALAFGMRDFAGTGNYSSEYLVATKHLGPHLTLSAGVGWGRIAGQARPVLIDGASIDTYKYWFSGEMGYFGGLHWQVNDRLSLVAEYSPDTYDYEARTYGFVRNTPYNFGAKYHINDRWSVGAYYAYGSVFGLQFSHVFNPKHPKLTGGRDGAPLPIAPRGTAAQTWAGGWENRPDQRTAVVTQTKALLAQQGLITESLTLAGHRAILRLRNPHYGAVAQAIGRAARALTRSLPAHIDQFDIIPVVNGMNTTKTTLHRADLERFEWHPDGAALSYANAVIVDGRATDIPPSDQNAALYPAFTYDIRPYLSASLFDPDSPLRADFGVQLDASFTPSPGVIFSSQLRYPLLGNLNTSTRASDSVLPHVRSDAVEYDKASTLEISHLTAEYFFRPATDIYGRITAGYLERMYAGVSAEMLWKPANSRLALGAELNYVKQRDFDVLFDLRDYSVFTGHLSAYYDFESGFSGQIDAGRYLAGDWGATLKFERRFANDWRVGVFMTLTDVPFEDFGEGAFDRGFYFHIPNAWLTGEPSREGYAHTVHLINRDGGAKLDVRNRLYDVVRDFQDPALEQRWGRFWR